MPESGVGEASLYLIIQEIIMAYFLQIFIIVQMFVRLSTRKRKHNSLVRHYSILGKIPDQLRHMQRMVGVTNVDCIVILRDVVSRVHGLKVPKGNYYLCDNGYANSDGFLTPYMSVRYHLKEWGPNTQTPQNPQEIFNMRHSKARNVIERAFGIVKMRWAILRSASYYPVKVQNRITMLVFYCIISYVVKWMSIQLNCSWKIHWMILMIQRETKMAPS